MGGQKKIAQGERSKSALLNVAQRKNISERLGHFFAVNQKMLAFNEKPGEFFACRALGLGDFVFVMRK